MQFFVLFYFIIDVFTNTTEALTIHFVETQNTKTLKLLIKHLFNWGVGLVLLFTHPNSIFKRYFSNPY